jgi:hypothetical protein
MQYHYVVFYDEDTDKFEIDVDTTMTLFENGVAFDPNHNVWHLNDELMEADYLDYQQMLSEELGGVDLF